MASLSPLKKSDVRLLEDQAIELGCNVSYLEKDYYLVNLIKCLLEIPIEDGIFIFTGGTALAKGYKRIERFSEDCDFIFLSSKGGRPYLSKIKVYIHTTRQFLDGVESKGEKAHILNAKNKNKGLQNVGHSLP